MAGTGDAHLRPVSEDTLLRAENVVVFDTQLPIGLVSLLVGFGLGMSGALTQVIARNPLATPDMLGITTGASAAAVAVIAFGSTWASWLADLGLATAAMFGGLATAAAMYLLTWRKVIDPIRLVLVGVGVSAGAAALTTMLVVMTDSWNQTRAITWLGGSTYGSTLPRLTILASVLALALAGLLMAHRHLDVLQLDADTPRLLGLHLPVDHR